MTDPERGELQGRFALMNRRTEIQSNRRKRIEHYVWCSALFLLLVLVFLMVTGDTWLRWWYGLL